MTVLEGKRILVGVTGGIAIYKTLSLLSMLNKAKAETRVVMSPGAQEFIRPLTFQTMSQHRVYTDAFGEEDHFIPHIDLTRECDAFLIAPASADAIAKIAHGLADDLLTATALASHCPLLLAPAMNVYMYRNPATQANLSLLRERGITIVEPNAGWLACNEVGEGRMPEAQELFAVLEEFFTPKDLRGKKILVTAGPTRERIDPVRFLTNDSSGRQGLAIAVEAQKRGAEVTLIHGPLEVEIPASMKQIAISSTRDLLEALEKNFASCQALIMAAAPSDYAPVREAGEKLTKKDTGDRWRLELVQNPDILQKLSEQKTNQVMIGFAAETVDGLAHAREKRVRKGLDYIVLNDVSQPGAGFNGETNIVTIVGDSLEKKYPLQSKTEVANHILDLFVQGA